MKSQSKAIMSSYVLCVLQVLLMWTSVNSLDKYTDIIRTTKGPVRGLYLTAPTGRSYSRFLGLPYATPPIGELRFQHPRPDIGRRTTRDCVEFKTFCPQDTNSWKDLIHPDVYEKKIEKSHTETAEDCLYLDIYVPGKVRKVTYNNPGLPVLVWFHGGGFENGTAMLYSLENLALYGGVIVVGVNYRLGVLGFLSLKDDIQGNFGLQDQLQALNWIQENIAFFGGNKKSVTLFGSEAGSVSVSLHVLSPLSKGRFKRAISQSGVALSYNMIQSNPHEAFGLAQLLAARVGCTHNDTAVVANCLRKVPIDDLMRTAQGIRNEKGFGFLPIIDDRRDSFLREHPMKILIEKRSTAVDYLIGVNSHEGYAFYNKLFGQHPDLQMTESVFEYQVEKSLEREYKNNIAKASRSAVIEYGTCAQNTTVRTKSLIEFLGDYNIVAPSYLMAQLHRKSGATTFFYELVHRPSTVSDDVPSYVSSNHGAEIDFIFNHIQHLNNVTMEEKILSEHIMDMWTTFARDGNFKPRIQNPQPSKEFSTENLGYLEISTDITHDSIKNNFRAQRMSFWNDYLAKMLTSESCVPDDGGNVYTDPAAQIKDDLKSSKSAVTGLTVFVIILIIIIIILVLIIIIPRCRKYRKERQPGTEHDQDQERGRECRGCTKCGPMCESMSVSLTKCCRKQKVYSPRREGAEAERREMMNDTSTLEKNRYSDDSDSEDEKEDPSTVIPPSVVPPPPPLPSANNTHTTV